MIRGSWKLVCVAVAAVCGAAIVPAGADASVSPPVGPAATPLISVAPNPAVPDNALCDSIGAPPPHIVTVTGSGFEKKVRSVKVLVSGTLVATATTAADGTFSAQFEDPQQPAGDYPVVAREGLSLRATATLHSSGQVCWSAAGKAGQPLHWTWQASGLDARSRAKLKVNGVVLGGARADNHGRFLDTFDAACPSTGTLPVTLVYSLLGVRQAEPAGSVRCR